MADANDYLNQRVATLEREKADLRAALKEARGERKTAVEKLTQLEGQLATLTTERDSYKSKAEAAPSEHAKRVAELEGQLRSRDHRDAFASEAAKHGVKPEHVADLYGLAQIAGQKPPETGEIKPEAFTEWLTVAKSAKSWAFGDTTPAPSPAGTNGAAQGSLKLGQTAPPSGAGRSASGTSPTQVRYSRTDIATPGWMQAKPDLVKAIADGTAVMVDA